jgi:hypothetical protein
VPGRTGLVDALQQLRARAGPVRRDHAGDALQAAVRHRRQQRHDPGLSLAAQHGVDRAASLPEHVPGDEGDAVPAEEDEAPRHHRLGAVRDADRLRDVGQVVQ